VDWRIGVVILVVIVAAIAGGALPGTKSGRNKEVTRQETHDNNYGCGNNGIHPDPTTGICP
jgi:hypothetical protein